MKFIAHVGYGDFALVCRCLLQGFLVLPCPANFSLNVSEWPRS